MPVSDEELAVAARTGQREPFDLLVERHASRVYAFCLRNVGTADDAEDLTQATFVAAFHSVSRYTDGRPFTPWLFGIAANQCRMFHRKRASEMSRSASLSEAWPDPSPTPEGLIETEERKRQVRRAVLGLPTSYREVVTLRYLQGMRVRDIAAALGLSVEAAAKRLTRGVDMLRERLAALEG